MDLFCLWDFGYKDFSQVGLKMNEWAVSCKGLYRQDHIDADSARLIKQTQGQLAASGY